MNAGPTDFVGLLDVEALDDDLYRGLVPAGHEERDAIYGGQVLAQAVRAAGGTVPGDRYVHSLHSYFVRPGRLERPVVYRVRRTRDGRSFSARAVDALQDGEVICSIILSFHVDEDSDYELDTIQVPVALPPIDGPQPAWDPLLEIHEVTRTRIQPGRKYLYPDRMWVRPRSPLPTDRHLHACVVAYVSDLGTGFGQLAEESIGVGGPTVDHTIWFHHDIDAGDWMLVDLRPGKGIRGRGVYLGAVRDRRGRLGAMLAQEGLLRRNPDPGSPKWPRTGPFAAEPPRSG